MIAFSSIRSLQDSHHPADCGMHASDWGRGPVAGRAQDDRKSWGGNFRVTVLAGLDHVGFQVTTTDGSAAGHHTHHHGARSSRGDSWELLGMRRLVANIYNTHTHMSHTHIYIYNTYYTIRKSSSVWDFPKVMIRWFDVLSCSFVISNQSHGMINLNSCQDGYFSGMDGKDQTYSYQAWL